MKALKKITFFIGLLFIVSLAHAEEYPRMWKLTQKKPNGTRKEFFILGVSHNGLNFEYDKYFDNRVLPVFDRAPVFYSESARLNSSTTPECINPLEKTPSNSALIEKLRTTVALRYYYKSSINLRLESFNRLEAEEIRSAFMQMAKSRVQSLSEYGLLIALVETSIDNSKVSTTGNENIVAYLKKRSSKKMHKSIDAPEDMLKAYCDLGDQRSTYLKKYLERYSEQTEDEQQKESIIKEENELLTSIKKLQLSILFDEGSEFEDSYVCKRNRRWANSIENDQSEGPVFLALGIAHVLPASWRKNECKDLLTLLQNRGFDVELVE